MPLSQMKFNKTYVVHKIEVEQDDIRNFLFSLGCYPGEKITIISKMASNYIVNIKDARYSIDKDLAKAIMV
ncbi:MAG: FeoA family protein [Eubacteriales bacterium]